MPDHEVKQGDCINSIGFQYGFFPKTLWNHPDNAELKTLRKDPNVLKQGDVVHIPDKNQKEELCGTEKLHKFKRRGVPSKFNLRLLFDDKPRSNEDYVLEIDGKMIKGKTDGDGWIRQRISPDAKEGKLKLKDGKEVYPLNLGHLDPVDEVEGVQGRLANLGYYGDEVNGDMNEETTEAIRKFQKDMGLEVSGEIDKALRDKLRSEFGS
jgi:N-acetylmuramoyl-L-alanine amidase